MLWLVTVMVLCVSREPGGAEELWICLVNVGETDQVIRYHDRRASGVSSSLDFEFSSLTSLYSLMGSELWQ